MKNKLDFLLNQVNIGTYNKCETIEIIGFNTKKKEAFNIFTLIIFENTKEKNIEEFLQNIKKLEGVKNLSWGIKRRIIGIKESQEIYDSLFLNSRFNLDVKTTLYFKKLKFI